MAFGDGRDAAKPLRTAGFFATEAGLARLAFWVERGALPAARREGLVDFAMMLSRAFFTRDKARAAQPRNPAFPSA